MFKHSLIGNVITSSYLFLKLFQKNVYLSSEIRKNGFCQKLDFTYGIFVINSL